MRGSGGPGPLRPVAGTAGAAGAAAVLRAAHLGPTLAVTLLAALLAGSSGAGPARSTTIVVAVLAGQLSIGWSNDLLDARRDRAVGRGDKPLATGAVSLAAVRGACAVAVLVAVVASLACGAVAGGVHLVAVAAGWAYNLGLKSTVWSWAPYAVAFGLLPVFVELAGDPGALGESLPPAWVPLGGALIGVGAHLVNVLPDLEDDAATGVRGLPHRLGARWTVRLAVVVLVVATAVLVVAAPDLARPLAVGGVAVVGLAVVGALVTTGRTPFRAAILVALVDVCLLVAGR